MGSLLMILSLDDLFMQWFARFLKSVLKILCLTKIFVLSTTRLDSSRKDALKASLTEMMPPDASHNASNGRLARFLALSFSSSSSSPNAYACKTRPRRDATLAFSLSYYYYYYYYFNYYYFFFREDRFKLWLLNTH